jgi:uncharacterized membrane protein YidH (DUF202 family)
VPQHFTIVLVGIILIMLALAEWIDQRRAARRSPAP